MMRKTRDQEQITAAGTLTTLRPSTGTRMVPRRSALSSSEPCVEVRKDVTLTQAHPLIVNVAMNI